MRRTTRRGLAAMVVVWLLAAAAQAVSAATIVAFSYSGRGGPDDAGLISTGIGSFSFADGLTTVGLGDLTSFALTLDENTPNTTTFGLANLTAFSAGIGPGLTVSGLSLATDDVQGNNPTTWPREFLVSSLDPGGASSRVVILGFSSQLTTGTVSITSVAVPEPSAHALAVSALLLAAGPIARRRRA